MFYLLYLLKEDFVLFNVFKYITFRSFGAGVTAFLISIILGKAFINFLSKKQLKEKIRVDGPPGHKSKAGTPTMGGAFIVIAIIVSALLWVNLINNTIWIVLLFTVSYALIGFADDWLKLYNRKGMRAKVKFLLQVVLGILFIFLLLSEKKGFTMS
ncbi:MAG: phospho-N-acetylmuramoyl-pentapeptide-transferase, partial [Thermodesulfobacteriota bacterium]